MVAGSHKPRPLPRGATPATQTLQPMVWLLFVGECEEGSEGPHGKEGERCKRKLVCREVEQNKEKANDSSVPTGACSGPRPVPGPRDPGEGVTVSQGCATIDQGSECEGTQRQESEICRGDCLCAGRAAEGRRRGVGCCDGP